MVSHQDIRRLRYFVEVVRAGSIRQAAERMRLSPAVMSEALSQLEAGLGVTLLRRTTRMMELTPTGAAVFERAADMTSAAEDALYLGRGAAQDPSGPLWITVSGELCVSWLPERLKAFETTFPDVHVEVVVADDTVALERSIFDVAISARFTRDLKASADVVSHIALECVCATGLADDRLRLDETLTRIGLVGRSTASRDHRTIWAGRSVRGKTIWSQFNAPCRVRATEHMMHHKLALEGFGAALLMRPTVEDDLSAQRLSPVNSRYQFGWAAVSVRLRDTYATAAARAFHEHLLSFGR